MTTQFVYSILNDFPGGKVYTSNLQDEIGQSSITANVVSIDTVNDVLTITFDTDLTSEEKTTLDGDTSGPAGGLIAAHDYIIKEATILLNETGSISTTSSSFITVSGMSGTPLPGNYHITFSGSIDNDSRNKKTEVTLYIDGVEIEATRRRTFRGRDIQSTPFSCDTYAKLTENQIVEGRWRVDAKSTGTIHERTLLIVSV